MELVRSHAGMPGCEQRGTRIAHRREAPTRAMPRKRRKPLGAGAEPMIRRVVGGGRRGRLLEQALARLPINLRPAADLAGWTSTEFLAHLEAPPSAPPTRRAGSETVRRINALAGVLPAEAVLLSRAITDTAPPAGEPVHPTLRSVLANYLPESLRAYAASRTRGPNPAAEQLLLAQLRLLYQVAVEVQRDGADQDHIDLRIQDAFLRERFAQLSPNALSLSDSPLPEATDASADEKGHPPAPPAGPVNADAGVEVNPVVLFAPGHPAGKLSFRLGIPKEHPTTLGAVLQSHGGAVEFRHTGSRRWLAQRRSTGSPPRRPTSPCRSTWPESAASWSSRTARPAAPRRAASCSPGTPPEHRPPCRRSSRTGGARSPPSSVPGMPVRTAWSYATSPRSTRTCAARAPGSATTASPGSTGTHPSSESPTHAWQLSGRSPL